MKHNILITTTDALVILKALRECNFENDDDKRLAYDLIETIKANVGKDLQNKEMQK